MKKTLVKKNNLSKLANKALTTKQLSFIKGGTNSIVIEDEIVFVTSIIDSDDYGL